MLSNFEMCTTQLIFYFLALCIGLTQIVQAIEDWVPTLVKFDSNCSHPELLKINVRSIRKTKEVYAFNGTAYLGVDLDDTFFGEINVYRNFDGSGEFKATPYKIQRSPFYQFMTMLYVKMLQKSFAPCSNLPQHGNTFDAPWKAGLYYINMCTFETDNMPGHIQPGHYKSVVRVSRDDFQFYVSIIFKVETKSFV